MISENSWMIDSLEFLIKSIIFFSQKQKRELHFSVVLQGEMRTTCPNPFNVRKINLRKINYNNFFKIKIPEFLLKNVDFHFSPYFWRMGMPCRWFIEPLSKKCIMIDVDMVACNDLSDVYNLEHNKVHGVLARNAQIIDEKKWSEIGFSEGDVSKYYINFGFVAVPSFLLRDIGMQIFNNYQRMTKLHSYHAGQLSLAFTLKQMNIPINLLNKKFNFPDKDEFISRKEILFLHLMKNKMAPINVEKKPNHDYCYNLVWQIKKEMESFDF